MSRAWGVVVAVLGVACVRPGGVSALELARRQSPPGERVTAGVVQFRGVTVSGALVEVVERSGERHQTSSAADGTFRLEVPVAAVDRVVARSGELVGLVNEPPHDWVDVVLSHPRRVTGVLVDASGAPVSGAIIESGRGDRACVGARGERPSTSITTDALGHFSVPVFGGEAWVGARGGTAVPVTTWGRAETDVRLTMDRAAAQTDSVNAPIDEPAPADALHFEASVTARGVDGQPLDGLHLDGAREVSASRDWWRTPAQQLELTALIAAAGSQPARMTVARRGFETTAVTLDGEGPRYVAQVQLTPARGVTLSITDAQGEAFAGCELQVDGDAQLKAISDARGELWLPLGPSATRVRGTWCCEGEALLSADATSASIVLERGACGAKPTG